MPRRNIRRLHSPAIRAEGCVTKSSDKKQVFIAETVSALVLSVVALFFGMLPYSCRVISTAGPLADEIGESLALLARPYRAAILSPERCGRIFEQAPTSRCYPLSLEFWRPVWANVMIGDFDIARGPQPSDCFLI